MLNRRRLIIFIYWAGWFNVWVGPCCYSTVHPPKIRRYSTTVLYSSWVFYWIGMRVKYCIDWVAGHKLLSRSAEAYPGRTVARSLSDCRSDLRPMVWAFSQAEMPSGLLDRPQTWVRHRLRLQKSQIFTNRRRFELWLPFLGRNSALFWSSKLTTDCSRTQCLKKQNQKNSSFFLVYF